jgi:gluconate kinase
MPAALLDSQLAILERPAADERPIIVDVAAEPAAIVATILRVMRDEDSAG